MAPRTKPAPDAPAPDALAPDALAPDATVLLAGVGSAFLSLSAAVAAVARFPNRPVPPALVDRITTAEEEVRAAIAALPFQVAVGVTPTGYDDTWIRETFADLNTALTARFDAMAADLAGLRIPPPPAEGEDGTAGE